MEKKHYVSIKGELIPVTLEVYKAYYSMGRRERTLVEKDVRNRLLYFDAWDNETSSGAEVIVSREKEPEVAAIDSIMAAKLRNCLLQLCQEERELIHAFFYWDETLASAARRLNIPRKTLEGRRNRILKKLRTYMESSQTDL